MQDKLWSIIEHHVFSVASTNRLFNPYRDTHAELDREHAEEIRRRNLRSYLTCFERAPRVLLVAEAPGPRGCRFSGVPFTSEAQVCDPSFPVEGHQSSAADVPYREYSGNIVWDRLQPHFPDFLIWNSVPLHPHKPNQPLSIRTPGTREVMAFAPLLDALIRTLSPERTIAIGRKAELLLHRLGVPHTYVRHPSQGGANAFRRGMDEVF